MQDKQLLDEAIKAIVKIKSTPEFCLLNKFDYEWLCLSKSEWAAYLQALGIVVTLIFTGILAKKSFVNQAKQTNRMNERAFATEEHGALVVRINICQFLIFSTENTGDIVKGLTPYILPTKNPDTPLRPPDARFALEEIEKSLEYFDTLAVIDSGCYQEFAELKLNFKRIKHHLSHIKFEDEKWKYSAKLEEVGDWSSIVRSVRGCLESLKRMKTKLHGENNAVLKKRNQLDKDIDKANYE